jgi:hypothetical protein
MRNNISNLFFLVLTNIFICLLPNLIRELCMNNCDFMRKCYKTKKKQMISGMCHHIVCVLLLNLVTPPLGKMNKLHHHIPQNIYLGRYCHKNPKSDENHV